MNRFEVAVTAGDLRDASGDGVSFPHRWTPEGVVVEGDFTGAHLLHLAVAGCVLNDIYREALGLNLEITGAKVTAFGEFDTETWTSMGIGYAVHVVSEASDEEVAHLIGLVDQVAEIPKAVRAGTTVERR